MSSHPRPFDVSNHSHHSSGRIMDNRAIVYSDALPKRAESRQRLLDIVNKGVSMDAVWEEVCRSAEEYQESARRAEG
jgi:hypothetical protein